MAIATIIIGAILFGCVLAGGVIASIAFITFRKLY